METNGKDTLSWLHGLEDFLKFTDRDEAVEYVHHYLNLNYSDDPLNTVKKLIISAKEKTSEEDFPKVLTFVLKAFKAIATDSEENIEVDEWAKIAKIMFPDEKIFFQLHRYFRHEQSSSDAISDAFSRGQIQSKLWLADELYKIQKNHDNVLVLAGWFGQFKSIYVKKLTYSKMRFVDLDRLSCEISDGVFNLYDLENYKVKSSCADINNMILHKNGYELDLENFTTGKVLKEKFLPDLIINTSAEHMDEEWFDQIRFKEMESNPIVAIQSNNLFDIPEHINCVHGIDHMKKKFPMKEILFEGELQLKGYKRVMLIGRP